MTFEIAELSDYDSSPIELYEFKYSTKTWRYTSGDEDILFNGSTYFKLNMSRNEISKNKEINKSNLKISMSSDVSLGDEFLIYPPSEIMMVSVFRLQRFEATTDFALIWTGRVVNAEWKKSFIEFYCEAILTSLSRPGLNRKYQVQCPLVLYGTRCKVDQGIFESSGNIVSVVNGLITLPNSISEADGYFTAGIVVFIDINSVPHKRAIETHVGQEIQLAFGIDGLTNGSLISIYPGCRHSKTDCADKFSNLINYGGFLHSPSLNPFDGLTLY